MKDIPFDSFEERISLYNGEVQLIFNPDLHVYYIEEGGERYQTPGVTNVLNTYAKDGLTWWAANMAVDHIISALPFDSEARRDEIAKLYLSMKNEKRREKRDRMRQQLGTVISFSLSTTELVSLLYDARGRHDRIKREAADVGKLAHNWLEGYIKAQIAGQPCEEPKPEDPCAVSCINAALEWMDRHSFKPYYSERKIYSRTYGYTGTTDWVGEVTACGNPTCCQHEGTHVELGDFKSCNSIHDENFMQTAAYTFALLEELQELSVHGRRILKLGKYDGAFEARTRNADQFEADFLAFLGLLQTYTWKQQFELDEAQEKLEAKQSKAEAKLLEVMNAPIQKPTRVRMKKKEYEPIPVAV